MEILQLIAWGYTNKEIAARFRLSAKTVETYKMRGLEKLAIKSRVELVRHALRKGWFGNDPDEVTHEPEKLGTENCSSS